MKKTFNFFILLLLSLNIFGQSPQSFKYQAVIRDANGTILQNQTIGLQITILQGSETGDAVYSETRTVQTNNFGLINLNIGEGTSNDDFTIINWGADNYYLKIELDENGGNNYTETGISKLLSVPYALYSNKSGSSVDSSPWLQSGNNIFYNNGNIGVGTNEPNAKLEIKPTGFTGDTLFCVKDNTGNPVFTVFSDAVQITVPESGGKTNRHGSFLVSGRSTSENTDTTYFIVTPDSTRVFVKDNSTKGVAGGFAVGRYTGAKGDIQNYFYTNPDSTRIFTNANLTKGVAGGFAVGRYTGAKTGGINYIDITPENMFIGEDAGINTTGINNSFFGYQAGYNNTEGIDNIFLGQQTGYNNIQGSFNVFMGQTAGYNNIAGHDNVFVGQKSGNNNLSGSSNVFVGQSSGFNNSNGGHNVAVGYQAGYFNEAGTNNIFIGNQAGYYEENSDKLYIENSDKNHQNALIYGDFDTDELRLNANVGIDIDNEGYKLNVDGDVNFYGNLYQNGVPYNPGLVQAELSGDLNSPLPYVTLTEGFMIYNIGANQPHGFYYWKSNQWVRLAEIYGPAVITNDVTNINLTSATFNGEVVNDGGGSVSERGFCYSTNPNPDVNGTHIPSGTGTGIFTANASGLTGNLTHYVRTYAVNQAGTSYGNQKTFVTTSTADITVTTPTSSDIWYTKYTYNIEWSDNISENVIIELWKGGVKLSDITTSAPSNGTYVWTVPETLTAGTDYQVKVISTNNSDINDISDNFEIIETELFVTAPAAGEHWITGNSYTISWTSNVSENVKIELYQGGSFAQSIVETTSNDGSFEYSVPTDMTLADDYTIKIISTLNTSVFNESNMFEISDHDSTLIVYYPFNGNANDESGNGNNGTVFGATLTTDRFGVSDKAYSFDGIDDYIAKTSEDINRYFTISGWVYIDDVNNKTHLYSERCNWGSSNDADRDRIYIARYSEDVYKDKFIFYIRTKAGNWTDADGYRIYTNNTFTEQTWYHICAVRNNFELKLYVNGQEQLCTIVSSGVNSNEYDLRDPYNLQSTIGRQTATNTFTYGSGKVDDLRIYNRVLTAQEISDLYHEGGWTGK